ncbi:MAG TPA: Tat pathway signal sequence [Nocardioides sp.]|nr:Tat pathway signal sequence [Nocardioides sp.]
MRGPWSAWPLAVVAAVLLVPGGSSRAGQVEGDPPRAPVEPVRGVTLESVGRLDDLEEALARHSRRPTARIVFQRGAGPAHYATAVRRLRDDADLMGLVLDSTAVRRTTVREYRDRTRAFVRRFGDRLDYYEIGNELNGEWLGRPRTINAKVAAAYDVVEREHADLDLRSVFTLNYWPSRDCYAHDWEATLPFARAMPGRVRRGVDLVLLSFYETACSPRARPSVAQFATTLRSLQRIFPGADVGIGEVGAQGRADGLPRDPGPAEKERIARRYVGMHDELRARVGPRFVGGYFWWYYATDAVPWDRPRSLWPVLEDLYGRPGRS